MQLIHLRNDYCVPCIKQSTMSSISSTAAFKAVALGLMAGMRTFSAPAVFTHIYSKHPKKGLHGSPLAFMQSSTASTVFKMLAAGELVGDKLPTAPNRTDLPGLTGRVLFGVLVGTSVYKAEGGNMIIGGILGGLSAAASTFGSYELRKATVERTEIPDPYIGAAEDLLVIGAAAALSAKV